MTTSAAAVVVRYLGSFSVTVHSAPVQRWSAGRARGLLQYLVINRGRPIVRQRLHDVLWPHTPWSSGSSSLKVAVHALRQTLAAGGDSAVGAAGLDVAGDDGADGRDTMGRRAPAIEICHDEYGYLLRADDIWVDVEAFEGAVDAATAAGNAGDRGLALERYRHAADLYRGDFLDGDESGWVVEQREWLRAKAMRALSALRDDACRRHAAEESIDWCRRILGIDPYQEATYRALMLTHARLGELGMVRRWHDICERRLRDELGVEPDPETGVLYRRLLGGPVAALGRPTLLSSTAANELSTHRTRTLTRGSRAVGRAVHERSRQHAGH